MNNFLNIPPLRKPRVHKQKVVTVTRYDHKKLYYDARRVMFERDRKVVTEAGFYYKKDYPDIKTTNGHTRYMKDVLNNLGHNADRNNTVGIPMLDKYGKPLLDKDGKLRYRKTSSTKGGTDMVNDIFVPGYPAAFSWKIETKNKDRMQPNQIKYQEKMNRIGILHSVIRVGELDLFWDEYYRIMKL